LVGSIFHMTRKIVSEMTYNVSMGTLNPTIPYPDPRMQGEVERSSGPLTSEEKLQYYKIQYCKMCIE